MNPMLPSSAIKFSCGIVGCDKGGGGKGGGGGGGSTEVDDDDEDTIFVFDLWYSLGRRV